MSKVEKPSNNSSLDPVLEDQRDALSENLDSDPMDLHRVLDQHLRQLKGFGISFLPAKTGQNFEIAQIPSQISNHEPVSNIPADPDAVSSAAAKKIEPRSTQNATDKTTQPKPSALPPIKSSDKAASADLVKESASSAPAPPSQTYSKQASKDRIGDLNVIASEVAACTKCSELVECRSQTVFGVGNPNARLVLIGEAPGEQEDKQGEPFVGAAGQLLDKMLAACGLNRREDVYILNAIKCRPPANRNPKLEELDQCWNFAQRQLEILQPEFICCLGSIAARTLLQSKDSVGRLRKRFHVYRESKVLVTYHPAYLLRTTSAKRHAWEDMQMLMNEMGIQIPNRT